MRALLSEFQLPTVLPIVQSVLNNSPLDRLGGRCQITAFTELQQDNLMLSIKSNIQGRPEVLTIEQVRARQLLSIGSAQEDVEGMHCIIATSVTKTREGRVRNHNKKTHVHPCDMDAGD